MKNISLRAPEGYDFTGEIRVPKKGEYYLTFDFCGTGVQKSTGTTIRHYPILLKCGEEVGPEVECEDVIKVSDVYKYTPVVVPQEFSYVGFAWKVLSESTHYLLASSQSVVPIPYGMESFKTPVIQVKRRGLE